MADNCKELWLALGLGLPLVLLAWVYHHSSKLQRIRSKGGAQVPPGRFWQLPFVGESIQFLRGSADDFMHPHMTKYGRVFRTHLLGSPAICTTTADAAKFVLQSPSLFKSMHSTSAMELMGDNIVHSVEGELHARYRKIIRSPITSSALKSFIVHVDHLATQFCKDKADQAIIHGYSEFLRLTLRVAMLVSCDHVKLETDDFLQAFLTMEEGLVCLSINLPGTVYNKAIKARNKIQEFVQQQIQKRRQEEGSLGHNDLLDAFLNAQGPDGSKLSDEQVVDNIRFVLQAGHETTSNTMAWALRNLFLHPKILELVKAENDAVAQGRKHVDDPITWEELKELTLTTKVLQETLRITNTAGMVGREATEDVVYDGMLLPKGWLVFVWLKYIHLDPDLHVNPLEFNPWRFETQPKTHTYVPFGYGNRACPGMELAMSEMLIFFHRFLTTYDFEAIGDLHKVKQWPMPLIKDGLPLRISRRIAQS